MYSILIRKIMEQLIKNITEKEKFISIINDFCEDNTCHLKIADKNIQVKLEKFADNKIFVNTQNIYIDCNTCFLTYKKEKTLLTVFCKYSEVIDKFIYTLEPLRIQFYNTKREEERNQFLNHEITEDHYFTDFISEITLRQQIENKNDQIGQIITAHKNKLLEHFDNVDITLVNKFKDIRMRFLHHNLSPVHIIDFNSEIDSKLASKYKDEVIDVDSSVKSNAYVSETLYPLIYRGVILLGYVQVNNRLVGTDSEYKMVEVESHQVVDEIESVLKIKLSDEKYNITDISESGLSIVTKSTSDIDLFEVDHFVYGHIVVETSSKKALILVKNINVSPEGYIRVGCRIASIM